MLNVRGKGRDICYILLPTYNQMIDGTLMVAKRAPESACKPARNELAVE